MSNKWRGLHGPITAAIAEAEPDAQRLFGPSFDARQRQHTARRQFSRPVRPISPETRALMKRIETRNTIGADSGTKRR